MVPPDLHSANAEAIAGESSAVPLEDLYLDGMVHVLGTVEFWASTAEAPRPMVRSSEIMIVMKQTNNSRRMDVKVLLNQFKYYHVTTIWRMPAFRAAEDPSDAFPILMESYLSVGDLNES